MIILILFAFLAGIVTILSPCILPVLPIILSSSVGGDKQRPLGIVTGFVLGFTFFTLFLSTLVSVTGIPGDIMRHVSVAIIILFGISLLVPRFQTMIETLFSRLSQHMPKMNTHKGFMGGLVIGLSLGLLWTPCVGPILASVISLALTGSVSGTAVIITLAYALGTALPMLGILYGGNRLLQTVPFFAKHAENIQKAFGILMILVALAVFFQWDRTFQVYILDVFPQYGRGLTALEDNKAVREQIKKINPSSSDNSGTIDSMKNNAYPGAPDIIPGGRWYNLPIDGINRSNDQGLTMDDLKGRVVLVKFWTYTCINCIRTLPYMRDWYAKYKDDGFVLLGVHTPEFEFEKNPDNVQSAITDFQLKFPVVQDNDYATWRAYDNHYWPALYLVDKEGKIRYTHFGEGKYQETESMIQQLLKERGVSVDKTFSDIQKSETNYARTPESYLGYERMEYIVSQEEVKPDDFSYYTAPKDVSLNRFAFEGKWQVGPEYSRAESGSTLLLHFQGKEVYLVMRAVMDDDDSESARLNIFLDNEPVSPKNAGIDVMNSTVEVGKDRLYHLISLYDKEEGVLRIEFPKGGVEVYAFTFG